VTVYLGTSSASGTLTGTNTGTESIAVGSDSNAGNNCNANKNFNGLVDEVTIYNYALTATQEALLFNSYNFRFKPTFPQNVASGSGMGKTGTVSSIAAYTDTSFQNGIYSVGCDLDVTAFTSGTINCQVTYTDWNSGAQTITIDSATALGDVLGSADTIMAKASTSIICKTTGTFTATYNEACFITLEGYQ